jgi:hypothetical protein
MRRRSVTSRPLLTMAALTALLWALLPALASAHAKGVTSVSADPVITISGMPQEGQTLAVAADWLGAPVPPEVSWQWLRCSAADDVCSPIEGATSARYVAAAADVGSKLGAELRVMKTNAVLGTGALTAVVAGVQYSLPPPLLDPFPVVRIRGRLTAKGARITLFTIRVPRSVSVSVRCRGKSCRGRGFTGRTSNAKVIRLRRFERPLRSGTRFTIKVTRAGWIGKWTTIRIRRGAAPKRTDQCAYPDARAPAPCPSG